MHQIIELLNISKTFLKFKARNLEFLQMCTKNYKLYISETAVSRRFQIYFQFFWRIPGCGENFERSLD